MPKFSKSSLDQLATCHLKLQELFNEIIKTYDCKVLEGHRNQADQDRAFNEGRSKLRFPNGNHNRLPSLAVDVYPFPISLKDTKRFYHFSGFVQGVAERMDISI